MYKNLIQISAQYNNDIGSLIAKIESTDRIIADLNSNYVRIKSAYQECCMENRISLEQLHILELTKAIIIPKEKITRGFKAKMATKLMPKIRVLEGGTKNHESHYTEHSAEQYGIGFRANSVVNYHGRNSTYIGAENPKSEEEIIDAKINSIKINQERIKEKLERNRIQMLEYENIISDYKFRQDILRQQIASFKEQLIQYEKNYKETARNILKAKNLITTFY